MEAIILAGGLGTRLRGAIGDLPKPMAPVGDKPFLRHLLEILATSGIDRVILSVGYRHEAIVDYFGQRFESISIDYQVESSPLGTGGAIKAALGRVEAGACFVLNGDTYASVDLRAMHDAHASAQLSMAVCPVEDVARFGALRIDGRIVTAMLEKGGGGPGYINAGVYLAAADLFEGTDLPERFSFESDFLSPRIGAIRPRAFEADGEFLDIGVPDDYAKAPALFERLSRAAPPGR